MTILFTHAEWCLLFAGLVGGYFIGSISSAILICWIFSLPDPRKAGSKNPGTTNVLRLGGKLPAVLTLVCDGAKGALPLLFVKWGTQNPGIISLVLLAPVIGHMYPLFFRFKGGKGVATTLGGLLALSPVLGGFFIATWLVVFVLSGYSSLSALITILSMPVWAWWFLDHRYLPALLILALLIIFKHQDNIKRLLKGKERKLSLKAKHKV